LEVLALLKDKARTVCTITSNHTVDDAVRLMVRCNVSALLVMENDQPAGIFSERDVFQTYLKYKSTAFSEIMLENSVRRNLMVAGPEDAVTEMMARMFKGNIKHLPVMEENKIVGILTLKDLMVHQIEALSDEVHQLKDYIDDLHDAGQY
jgi:CBS domain-containing protein